MPIYVIFFIVVVTYGIVVFAGWIIGGIIGIILLGLISLLFAILRRFVKLDKEGEKILTLDKKLREEQMAAQGVNEKKNDCH